MKPLSSFRPGARVRLVIFGGLEPEVLGELASLRLLPGEVLTIVEVVGRSGPILVHGAGGLYALGRRLAGRLHAEGTAA